MKRKWPLKLLVSDWFLTSKVFLLVEDLELDRLPYNASNTGFQLFPICLIK